MAEDLLVIGSQFDPSGIIKGIDLAGSSLAEFEKMVQAVSKSLPGLPLEAQFKIAAEGIKGATQQAKQYEAALKAIAGVPAAPPLLGPLAPPNVIRDKVAQLRTLSGQLQQSAAAANEFAASSRRMDMSLLAGASSRIGDGGASFSRGLANIAAANAGVATSFTTSAKSANLMRGALAQMAVQATGTSGAVGQLAQSVLFFGGGTAAVIGFAAAIAATAFAYEKMTAAARKAVEENKRLIDAQRQRQLEVGDPGGLQRTIIANQQERIRLAKEIAGWERAIVQDAMRGIPVYFEVRKLLSLQNQERQIASQLETDLTNLVKLRAKPAEDLLLDLQGQLAVLRDGEDATKRLAIANSGLHPAVIAAGLAMHDQVVALKAQKEAAEEAARALEAMLRIQHEVRVANAGGGNLTQGAGGTATGPFRGGLLSGATPEEITNSRYAASVASAEKALQKFFDTSFRGFRILAQHQAGVDKGADRLVRSLTDMGTAAFALSEIGRQFGFIDEQAMRTLDSVGRLNDAFAELAKGVSFGSITGAIVSVTGFLASLLGGGPSETDKLLAENSQRLLDLRISLDAQLQTAGVLASELAAVQGLMDVPLTQIGTRGDPRGAPIPVFGPDVDEMRERVEAAGLTVQEWADRVEAITGLDVLDSRGHIVADTLEQARQAFELLIHSVTHLSSSIQDQQLLISTRQRVFGVEGGELDANRELLLGGLKLDAAWESRIAALDLRTAAGQQAYQEFVQEIFRLAAAGKLTADELNEFDVRTVMDPLAEGAELARERMKEAAEAIRLAAEAAAAAAQQFRDAFPSLLGLRDQLLGATGPADEFARALTELTFIAPDLAQMFQGVDLEDPKAREALRERMLALVEQMMGGQLALEELGITPELLAPFLEFLGVGADVLDRFNEGVQAATGALLNMPQGINLAALEFRAQAAAVFEPPTTFHPSGRSPGLELGDARGFRGTDGSQLPVQTVDQRVMGSVTIVIQGAGKNAQEIAREVEAAIQQKNLNTTGNAFRGRR